MTHDVILVGLGQIGMGYDLELDARKYIYTHARAFSLHPDFNLVAGVDQDSKKCTLFKNHYQLPVYEDIKEALNDFQPDCIVVAVPTKMHNETVKLILSHCRPKAILCEKPLSYSLEDALEIVESCSKRGVHLYVNYVRRGDPGVMKVDRWLKSDRIRVPVKGIAWYSKGVLHNGSHLMDLLTFWLGSVNSFKIISPGRSFGQDDHEPDFLVSFDKGDILFSSTWEEEFTYSEIELIAPNGRLRYENFGELIYWQKVIQNPVHNNENILSKEKEIIKSDMDCYQLNIASQLSSALKGLDHSLCTAEKSLMIQKMLNDIIKKSKLK
jgi:predicted dehydrogenase